MTLGRSTNYRFWRLSDNNGINWQHTVNANVDIVNNVVLKLQGISNVNPRVLKNGAILKYNASTSKWDILLKRGYSF